MQANLAFAYSSTSGILFLIQIYESVYFGHLPPQVTVTLNNLALCYRRQGQHEEARKIYKRYNNNYYYYRYHYHYRHHRHRHCHRYNLFNLILKHLFI